MTIDRKYIKAYAGILSAEELEKAHQEFDDWRNALPPILKDSPRAMRLMMDVTPDWLKTKLINGVERQAAGKSKDYSFVTGGEWNEDKHTLTKHGPAEAGKTPYTPKLNGRMFTLTGNNQLRATRNARELSNCFPAHKPTTAWPTLVLVSNSDLVSPEIFYDSFKAAQDIVPRLAHTRYNRGHLLVAGSYFSAANIFANGAATDERIAMLDSPEGERNSANVTNEAVDTLAHQLLDLLLMRDENGHVIVTGDNPHLRPDAQEVMKHIVCYGYSSGHLKNKDAFRLLKSAIAGGCFWIEDAKDPANPHISTLKDAETILSEAKIIGVAGVDRMNPTRESAMQKEVNFISKGDFALSMCGTKLLKNPANITLSMEDGDGKTLRDDFGSHLQETYLKALKSPKNHRMIEIAKAQLTNSRGAAR